MAVSTFASIYIGSFEVTLKIFEFSNKKNIKAIDEVSARLDLGKDTYVNGNMGYEMVDELCDVLAQFRTIMDGYKVKEYEVYASTVMREISNELFVLDQIHLRTGFDVKVISNSEHRFISYKSVAGQEQFENIIQKSAAVIDMGGVSIQITLFKNGHIVTTQHMDIGTIKLRELLHKPGCPEKQYKNIIEEYLNKKLEVFRALYMEKKIEYIVFMNDSGLNLMKKESDKAGSHIMDSDKFVKGVGKLQKKTVEEIMEELKLSNDKENFVIPSLMLIKSLVTNLTAEKVWIPGVNVNDGIAFDYADRHALLKGLHNFDEDVITAAKALSEHYNSYSKHIEALNILSVKIFDTLKKSHGLGNNERLLLQIATILHDCGKYVSLSSGDKCAYDIIMSSEIIGLSHSQRQIVALTVLFNSQPLCEYEDLSDEITKEEYLVVAKLSAILRVANALDQSHRQKFRNIKIALKGKELIITVESFEDMSLEQILFEKKTSYFENVFSIKPVLKEKKIMM
ncbi:Ppx/GppA phosphatase family protein [Agathobacter sp.]